MSANEIEFCRSLAIWLHRNKVDKQGRPYIDHVSRVVARLPADSPDEVICAAWLHDTLEDTTLTHQSLYNLGISAKIVNTVTMLTRMGCESYSVYIDLIAQNTHASIIKLADLADNTDPRRGVPANTSGAKNTARIYRYANAKAHILSRFHGLDKNLRSWEGGF